MMPLDILKPENMVFVSKPWGYEIWIVNGRDYCGKILFIRAGKKTSFHYHKVKDEVLYVQSGFLRVPYDEEDRTAETLGRALANSLRPGEAMHIYPGLRHQLEAIEDTTVYEFSTHHEDADSYRVVPGSQ